MSEGITDNKLYPPAGYANIDMPPKADSGSTASEFLTEAAEIVRGDRNVTHGEKAESFAAIAALQSAYLRSRVNPGANLRPSDVAAMMILTKLCRAEWGVFLHDHAVDAAGYAGIWGELKRREDADAMEVPF